MIPSPAASRSRFTLLRFAFALSVITFVDRVCISSAAPAIREELGLDAVQMGWVFSAFTFAYAFFEIPSGWLGDVIGPRKVLMRIVVWWSAFTMITGATWNFISLTIARFLFGVGEAGAFPNISRSFARWFPTSERGTAHGVVFLGSRLGGALAPPLVALIMGWAGWRFSFFIFGLVGLIWSVYWWRWFQNEPGQHPSVNAAELKLIREGTQKDETRSIHYRDLLNLNLLLICLMYFCIGYGLYFYLTWLPTYLREARGFSLQAASLISGLVLATAGVATLLGGWITDRLVKAYGLKIGRSVGLIAMPFSGLLLLAVTLTENATLAAILLAAAAGAADLCLSSSWAMCHDIGGEVAGTVTGCMNTFGNLGGAISPLVVGYAVQWWGSWSTPLLVTSCVYILGGALTLLINPRKRLVTHSIVPSMETSAT